MSMYNNMSIYNLPNIGSIKDDIIDIIEYKYNKKLELEYNLINNNLIYNTIYEEVKLYVDLILDFKDKCSILNEYYITNLNSIDKLNLLCTFIISETLHVDLYPYILVKCIKNPLFSN